MGGNNPHMFLYTNSFGPDQSQPDARFKRLMRINRAPGIESPGFGLQPATLCARDRNILKHGVAASPWLESKEQTAVFLALTRYPILDVYEPLRDLLASADGLETSLMTHAVELLTLMCTEYPVQQPEFLKTLLDFRDTMPQRHTGNGPECDMLRTALDDVVPAEPLPLWTGKPIFDDGYSVQTHKRPRPIHLRLVD